MQKLAERKPGFARPVLWAVTALLAAGTVGLYAHTGGAGQLILSPLERTALAARAGGLDLNEATAEDLQELPGIGPVLAERMLAWRAENGPFTGPEDVLAVKGVGPATYEAMAPYIEFGARSAP